MGFNQIFTLTAFQTMQSIESASIRDLIEQQQRGTLRALDIANHFIAQTEAREAEVRAFSWFSAEAVREQASRLDQQREAGKPLGALHGIPIALKDIIDTADIPTENGTPIDAGRVPEQDARVVQQLRQAGAVIFAKSRTTPFAFLTPCETRNPHNLDRTPGGSSSGSAAAVAAGMVPLALGTQTGGSVIRPASFCGVYAIKPSFGVIESEGVLLQSATLDTLGVFARSTEDLQTTLCALTPTSMQPVFEPTLRLGVVEPPGYERASAAMKSSLQGLAAQLGDQAVRLTLPEMLYCAPRAREIINFVEMAKCYRSYKEHHESDLPSEVRWAISEGEKLRALEYLDALDYRDKLNKLTAPLFDQVDGLVMPAATGEAPGLETTGDAIFNGIWTLCGTPAITLPLFSGETGLPMGLQLVGRFGEDAKLLCTATQLEQLLNALPTA